MALWLNDSDYGPIFEVKGNPLVRARKAKDKLLSALGVKGGSNSAKNLAEMYSTSGATSMSFISSATSIAHYVSFGSGATPSYQAIISRSATGTGDPGVVDYEIAKVPAEPETVQGRLRRKMDV